MLSTTVTVSDFRANLSKYLDLLVNKKRTITLIDGRKGKVLANLINRKKKKEFDWDAHMKFIGSVGGKLFTAEDVKDIERARKATEKRFKELNW